MSGCHYTGESNSKRESLYARIRKLEEAIKSLIDQMIGLNDRFSSMDNLIKNAEHAEYIFARKVHDLKDIDKKRDDVINNLCQKIENIDKRLMKIELRRS